MAGNGFSGYQGTVKIGATDIAEIRGWKWNPKSHNPKYASNKTSGYKRTVAGVKEGSGSMSGAWDHVNDFFGVIDVGTSATLLLYTNPTHSITVPSVIDDISVNVDVDNGEIVSWDANFSSNGAWTNAVSPMMAPEGLGIRKRKSAEAPHEGSGEGEGHEEKPSAFSAEQMSVIASTAASAAAAAMQKFFENLAAANPAFAVFNTAKPAEPPADPAPAQPAAAPVESPTQPAGN